MATVGQSLPTGNVFEVNQNGDVMIFHRDSENSAHSAQFLLCLIVVGY